MRRSTLADFAAKALVLACVLNLNGVANMMFDVGQAVSLVMLAAPVVILTRYGNSKWSKPLVLLVATILSYLFLATLYGDPLAETHQPMKYYISFGGGLLIILSVAIYTAARPHGSPLDNWLAFLRNSLLVAAASVWASPILYTFYVNAPPSSFNRMGGFFGNPNEAGIASLLAVGMVLGFPFRWYWLQLSMLLLAAGAAVLTFSKTAMSGVIVVLTWHLLRQVEGFARILLPLVALVAIIIIQDFNAILSAIAESPLLDLDHSQKGRILALADILTGKINQETSTHRTLMWEFVLKRAWEDFPSGSGLGSAHHIAGFLMEGDVWQGVHNTFLMLLGEAGPIPPLLLVAFLAILIRDTVRYQAGPVAMFCLFPLVLDFMATHGALSTRYHNVMLGAVVGLVANRRLREAPRRLMPKRPFRDYSRAGAYD